MAKFPKPIDMDGYLLLIKGSGFYSVEQNYSDFDSCCFCKIDRPKENDFCKDCALKANNQFLKRFIPVTEEMRKDAEKFRRDNPDAGWFVFSREEDRTKTKTVQPDNRAKTKTFIETMDMCSYALGGKFYQTFDCGPEIDPCKCCQVSECPFMDCPFAKYGRCIKEIKHPTEDLRMAAERERGKHPKSSFLVINPNFSVEESFEKKFEESKKSVDDTRTAQGAPKTAPTFKEIADRIVALQEKKNRSYGNAFEQSCDKYGIVSALTRLNDKMNRLDALHKASEDEAFGESFTDTLTDLAAYAIMTIEYIENKKNTLTNSE